MLMLSLLPVEGSGGPTALFGAVGAEFQKAP